ncbi:MAG: GDPmannose 4,6-dehydratase [Parasphingorhabdus sp.]|jgi:GDPmannose 4,6-dehydratase
MPYDLMLSTGQINSVRTLCEIAFSHVNLDYENHIKIDERIKRKGDKSMLVGDSSETYIKLGWRPKNP